MDTLQHDPRTKQLIKETLWSYLYHPVKRQLEDRLTALIIKNTYLGGNHHKSFNYKGQLYSIELSIPRKWNRLVPQLKEEMDAYLKDKEALQQKEIPYVEGYINQVLNSSDHFDDYLRLLPESMHRPLTTLAASCPCKSKKLSDQQIKQILDRNQEAITLVKQRLVTNLLL